jgi:hypothetical protein
MENKNKKKRIIRKAEQDKQICVATLQKLTVLFFQEILNFINKIDIFHKISKVAIKQICASNTTSQIKKKRNKYRKYRVQVQHFPKVSGNFQSCPILFKKSNCNNNPKLSKLRFRPNYSGLGR